MLAEKVRSALRYYLMHERGDAPHYEVKRSEWRPDHDNQRAVSHEAGTMRGPVLHPPVTIYADGVPVIYHGMLSETPSFPLERHIYQRLLNIPVHGSGMVGDTVWAKFKSTNFGALAPAPRVGRPAPQPSALSLARPGFAEALGDLFSLAWHMMLSESGELGVRLSDSLEHPEAPHHGWRLGQSHWTSGQIYDSAALPYHRDDSRSAVPGSGVCIWNFRHRTLGGGGLHFPELDLTLAQPSGSVVIFNGADLYHGVTPIRRKSLKQKRFAVLAYSKRGLSLSPDESLREAQRDRTAKELVR